MSRPGKIVGIDEAHCKLIYGLIVSHKPRRILEFGLGEGLSAHHISEAIAFNNIPFEYTIVENWVGWEGQKPDTLPYLLGATLVESSEREFVEKSIREHIRWDFILSDADHSNSNKWFWDVWELMLNTGGIFVLHDITNANHPNLRSILEPVTRLGWRHAMFNKSSKPDEECERGLLVIFK
jgi:predicted O-methyltransferase YrrM